MADLDLLLFIMITAITIDRTTGDGKYTDIIDTAELLGDEDYGSAVNAIAVMVRQSPLFQDAQKRMKKAKPQKSSSGTI